MIRCSGVVTGADGLKTGHRTRPATALQVPPRQNGRRLVMVVAGLSSFNQRISESVRFIDWGFHAWQSKPLFKQGAKVETADVQLGSESQVGLVAPQNLAVTLPGGTASNIQVKVVYDGPIKAPSEGPAHRGPGRLPRPTRRRRQCPWSQKAMSERQDFRPRLGRADVLLRLRPHFISLEGGEGVGKSTQARRLTDALRARGIDVLLTREPGGSPGRGSDPLAAAGRRRQSLVVGARLCCSRPRARILAKTIAPALQAGRWVLCDRFLDNSRAYQGVAGEVGDDAILDLHRIGSDGMLPDRTLVLSLTEAEAAARAAARDAGSPDRIGGREADFHADVARAFRDFAHDNPDRIRLVDASGAAEEVTERLVVALEDLMS